MGDVPLEWNGMAALRTLALPAYQLAYTAAGQGQVPGGLLDLAAADLRWVLVGVGVGVGVWGCWMWLLLI